MESKVLASHGRSGARQSSNAIMSHAGGNGELLQDLKLAFFYIKTTKEEGARGWKGNLIWYLSLGLCFCCHAAKDLLQNHVCVIVRGWAHWHAGVVEGGKAGGCKGGVRRGVLVSPAEPAGLGQCC